MVKGKIHSFQSLGTVDGPGVRFVVFLQGCPLRCSCCHNPDTWDIDGGNEYYEEDVLNKVKRFKEYFGKDGGVTLSGGEPLLQAEFSTEIFKLCKDNSINTCLDTSGCVLNESVKKLLAYTDRVLLDIKYTDNDLYHKHVGMSYDTAIKFLEYLNLNNIKTTIRQVIIPTLNDNEKNICNLKKLQAIYPVIDKIELLPLKKICQTKYDELKIEFPCKDIPTPTKEQMDALNNILK